MMDVGEIDSRMRYLWLDVVQREHNDGRILKEPNLQSTVQFHFLREEIERLKNKKIKPFVYKRGTLYEPRAF
jgi:hypothetical protein